VSDRGVRRALHHRVEAGLDLEAAPVDPLLAVLRLERAAHLLDEVGGEVDRVAVREELSGVPFASFAWAG
jgi:hypothetical protein